MGNYKKFQKIAKKITLTLEGIYNPLMWLDFLYFAFL